MKLSLPVLALALLVCISSCKKDEAMPEPVASETEAAVTIPPEPAASYKLVLTGKWQARGHTVPAGNHFTTFHGMVHNNTAVLFRAGFPASTGVENVAEEGNSAALLSELNNYITAGTALSKFQLHLPTITSVDSLVINFTTQHSMISFESMIAPSPDWFAGLDSYNLIQNGKWISDITIDIAGYDAGTENGDIFGYSNPATLPQQNVALMTANNASVIANGNASVAPFATLRFIKQ